MHAYAHMHTHIRKCFPKRLGSWVIARKLLFSLTNPYQPCRSVTNHTMGNHRISYPNHHKKRANPKADPFLFLTYSGLT